MKRKILENKRKPGHARGRRGRTAALLGGLVLALTLPGTGLRAQVPEISKSVLLSWPEPTQEQIVVGSDSLTGPVWTPWPEPIFKRFGQVCMAVPTTASQQYFKAVLGRQFADCFSDCWGPFTNRNSWTPWFTPLTTEWIVTNGVLRVCLPQGHVTNAWEGLALCPLGATNVEANLRDVSVSVDILDWGTSSSSMWSSFYLFARGYVVGPTSGNGYFGGLVLNADGIPRRIVPFILTPSGETRGATLDIAEIPPPYRLQFSVLGTKLSFRVLNPATGQLIREVPPVYHSQFTNGIVGLFFRGDSETSEGYTNTVDNFFVSGTK